MKVRSVEPDVDADALLPGAQFIDAYSVTVSAALDARHAAEQMTARGPRWTETLLRLRNRLVGPLGLKTAEPTGNSAPDRVGIFPVLSERPDRLVAGLDDAHL
ncbi:MAG TPA: DUF2867 domain-containing protein, partial [Bradyrhizobium sp.]|nr:DUF2867 domain-containing protein [Bradyrhizobium sp.]